MGLRNIRNYSKHIGTGFKRPWAFFKNMKWLISKWEMKFKSKNQFNLDKE